MEASRILLFLCFLAAVLAEGHKAEESRHHVVRHLHLKKKHHHYIKKVPIPYRIKVLKKIPVPVKIYVKEPYYVYVKKPYVRTVLRKVRVPVRVVVKKPYPVYVEKKVPYPVRVPVVKKVPYPVKEYVRVPVKVPVYVNVDESHVEELNGHDDIEGHPSSNITPFNRYTGKDYGKGQYHGFEHEHYEEIDPTISSSENDYTHTLEVADFPKKATEGGLKYGSRVVDQKNPKERFSIVADHLESDTGEDKTRQYFRHLNHKDH